MDEQNAFDLGLDLGLLSGYDIGFEAGSWAGYYYALEKLINNKVKRDSIIVLGTIIAVVPVAVVSAKIHKKFSKKSKGMYKNEK